VIVRPERACQEVERGNGNDDQVVDLLGSFLDLGAGLGVCLVLGLGSRCGVAVVCGCGGSRRALVGGAGELPCGDLDGVWP
jgi:hypothetical protein